MTGARPPRPARRTRQAALALPLTISLLVHASAAVVLMQRPAFPPPDPSAGGGGERELRLTARWAEEAWPDPSQPADASDVPALVAPWVDELPFVMPPVADDRPADPADPAEPSEPIETQSAPSDNSASDVALANSAPEESEPAEEVPTRNEPLVSAPVDSTPVDSTPVANAPLPAEPAATEPAAEVGEPAPPTVAQSEPFTAPEALPGNPPPRYPGAARRRGYEGTVLLRVRVAADGTALDAVVLESSGHRLLDAAAVAGVKAWRFTPARRGLQAVVHDLEVPITFRLRDAP